MSKLKITALLAGIICFLLLVFAVMFFYANTGKIYQPQKALNNMPEQARVFYLQGINNLYKQNLKKAAENFESSIAIKPSAEAYCELAIINMEKKQFDQAIEMLKKSIQLNPRYPKSQYAIAVCYTRIDPINIKLAKTHLTKAKELGYNVPENFERYLLRLQQK